VAIVLPLYFSLGATMSYQSLPIDSIIVDRPARQRKELTQIEELANSIREVGQLQPIIIKRDNVLVAGERRYTAIKSLGWTHIDTKYIDELDPAQIHLIELEENIKRVDLSWQDQCLAVEQYHQLRASLDPEWNNVATAEALGVSQSDVSAKRAVAAEIQKGNTRVLEAPKFSVARGITQRDAERKRDTVVHESMAEMFGVDAIPEKVVPLLNADFHEWQPTYSGPKFNFIHCDFPYGVNADKHDQGKAAAFGGYEDSEEVYWGLLDRLAAAMENVIAPSAHLMFWFSMDFYEDTVQNLTDMGWKVNPFPLIWHKSDNMGILPDPTRGPRRIYETCLMASRGDRKIIRAVSNVVSHPTTKEIHMSEKPIGMLTKFMEMFVDEHTSLLDPTCGSGNAIRAGETRGAHAVLGLERDIEFYNRAKEAYLDEPDNI
jgi:ParB/RepB/Spo0J family partition protein